jgi:hypothetical protein
VLLNEVEATRVPPVAVVVRLFGFPAVV